MMKKKNIKGREGFTLIIVLLGLAVMSVFGVTILGATTSNFKMTKVDSKSQAAFYIAEAGVNHIVHTIEEGLEENVTAMSAELFFDEFEDKYTGASYPHNNFKEHKFEENFGETPEAEITIEAIDDEGNPRDYKITSIGSIGNNKRTVDMVISITYMAPHGAFDYALYSLEDTKYPGGANIVGSIYGGELTLESSQTKVTGDIYARKNITLANAAIVTGNIYAREEVVLKDSQVKVVGDIHAGSNVKLGSGAKVKDIYTNGQVVLSDNNITGEIYSNGHINSPDLSKLPEDLEGNSGLKIPLKSFELGSEKIEVMDRTIKAIEEGHYKDLKLGDASTVRFTNREDGHYYFENINGNNSNIKLQLDLSKGPINIYTAKNITFGSGLQIFVSEDGTKYDKLKDIDLELAKELAGKVYWEVGDGVSGTGNFKLPENCYFIGSVLANNNFKTGSNTHLIGAYAVNEGVIEMDYSPTIIHAPPTTSAAGSGSGQKQKARVKTVSPITEK